MRDEEKATRGKARQLRRSMTKAEVILWVNLRALRSEGYAFRRQHPIGPYIADFAFYAGKLVIEVDGPTHDSINGAAHDRRRDVYLERRGWHVLRIPNTAVYTNIESVVETILSQIPPPARTAALVLATSPASGGG